MKVLLQRVTDASVQVDGETVGAIGPGLLLLCGAAATDLRSDAEALAEKTANLRIFPDDRGRFHYSLKETGGAALVVSQFTLLADTSKGRRPEFFSAMPPQEAASLIDYFVERLRHAGIKDVQTGRFGAMMQVSLVNDGPVTILLESPAGR